MMLFQRYRKHKNNVSRRFANTTARLKLHLQKAILAKHFHNRSVPEFQLRGIRTIPKEPNEDDAWGRLMLLPWDMTWHLFLLILTFITTCLYIPLLTAMALMTDQIYEIFSVAYTGEIIYTIDIVLYVIAINNPFIFKPTVNSVNRPMWILIIDVISILPLQLFVGYTSLYNKLCMIHCLKFVRIQYFLRYNQNMLFHSKWFLWFEIIFWFACTISFGTLIAVAIECNLEVKCTDDLLVVVQRIVSHVTNSGYYEVPDETNWTYIKLITGLPFVIVTIFLAIATRAQHIYRDCYKKTIFTYQYEVTKQILDNLSTSPFMASMYNNCYQTIWTMCDGYTGYLAETLLPYAPYQYKKYIPKVLWVDVMEDIASNFFHHSILFTDMDRPFLRALSAKIKCLVYSKGQLLYIKNDMADKMVYIVSGLVQIISSEDEETSELDMISGTCLGETALLFPKTTVSSIRCAKDSEILVLDSKSYFRIAYRYPEQHKVVHKIILDRIKNVRSFKKKADAARKGQLYNMVDMMWMNHMLHKLAGAANRVEARRHQLQNIHLRASYSEEQLTNIPRMIQYLRLINIAARTLDLENSNFLETAWPYIIHPKGIMRQLLEIIVIACSFCAALVIPYTCFIWESTIGIEMFQLSITFIWTADIWMQVHTAVMTEEGMIIEPWQILRYRLTTVDFIIDIFSCLPLEIITVLFVARVHYPKFQINRAAKLWRIHRMFQRWENKFRCSITTVRVIEIFCFLIYGIYVSACVMYSVSCEDCDHSYFEGLLPVAVQLCTGISLQNGWVKEYTAFYSPMMVFSWFIGNACIANMIAEFQMRRVLIYKAHQRVQSFKVQIPAHRKDLLKNLELYVATQEEHGQNVTIIYKQQFLDNLTRQQMRIISELHIGPTIRKCPLFADLGDDNILELCSLTEWRIKPAGDVFMTCGDIQNYLMILLEGQCEVVNGQTGKNRGVRTQCSLNDLEVLLDEPLCQTVVTVTNCRVILFDVVKLKRMFNLFPEGHGLQATLDSCKDIKQQLNSLPRYDVPLSKFKYFTRKKPKTSFYDINKNKKTRLFYMRHFSNLNFFSFFRFLLLTTTIRPDGQFIFVWEVFRSICAALSTIIYIHVKFVCVSSGNFDYYLLLILDLACYVDIYLRLHVGYYNKQGLLIQHPLFTARNYIYGAFLIDFLTCLPFRFSRFFKSKPTHLMRFHMLKVFQLYRYFALVYIKVKSVKAKIFFFLIPICALAFHFIANCAILMMCDFDDCAKWPTNFNCIEFGGLSQQLVDDGYLYLYSVYIVTSIMTTTGLQGLHYVNQYFFFWFLNVLSILLYAAFTGLFVSIYPSYDRIYLKYQQLILTLRNFMNREQVPTNLQSVVLDYYHRCWDIRKGQNLDYIMQPFSFSLKRDVLYEIFGKKILANWVLETEESILFMKRMLLHTVQLLILPGHDVLELNDVCPFMYIIVDGSVIVKDKDKTIKTKLTVGAIFGNITEAKTIRINTSFTAFDVLQMLYLPTTKFLEYLKRFPACYEEFQQHARGGLVLNYIANKKMEVGDQALKLTDAKSRNIRQLLNTMLYLAMYVCILGTVLHIVLYLYQVAVRYTPFYYDMVMYAHDGLYGLLFVVLYLLRKYALFQVNYGWFQKYHIYLFVCFLFTLIPFELLAYEITDSSDFFYVYISLKAFRFLRIIHVYYIQKTYLLKFSQHMVFIRMLAIIINYILMIMFCTAMLSLSSQLFQPNFNPYVDADLVEALVGYDKFILFLRMAAYITNTVLKITNIEHQPMSYLHTIIMIVMMVTIRLAIILGIAEISWIIYDKDLPRLTYRNKLMNMFCFLNRWGCSRQIMEKVENYLEINWYDFKGEAIPLLYTYAPRYLKRCLASHCYLHYIVNHMVFGKCPTDFQRQLVLQLQSEVHEQGQFILVAGTHNSITYWIHHGQVLQIKENGSNVLNKGDSFAYQEGTRPVNITTFTATYKALTQVVLLCLERKTWIDLLDHFPDAKVIIDKSMSGSTADIIEKVYH